MEKKKILLELEKYMGDNIPSTRQKEDYLAHVFGVRKYALLLADRYPCDTFVLEVSALLHDVGAYVGEEHCIESARIAEQLLPRYGILTVQFNLILACIQNHSTHSKLENGVESVEEQIIRDADGLSFMENNVLGFLSIAQKKHPPQRARQKAEEKVNAMYRKITTEYGKFLAKPLYEKAMELLGSG